MKSFIVFFILTFSNLLFASGDGYDLQFRINFGEPSAGSGSGGPPSHQNLPRGTTASDRAKINIREKMERVSGDREKLAEISRRREEIRRETEETEERIRERERVLAEERKRNTGRSNPPLSSLTVPTSVIKMSMMEGRPLDVLKKVMEGFTEEDKRNSEAPPESSIWEKSEDAVLHMAGRFSYEKLLEMGLELKGRFSEMGADLSCFPEETLVKTKENEFKRISDIKIGDEVLSYDFDKNEIVSRRVKQVHRNYADSLIVIAAGGKFLKVTENHPFFVFNDRTNQFEVLSARELARENFIFDGHSKVKIDFLDWVRLDERISVFNLTVENPTDEPKNNNYFVSDNEILVHNCGVKLLSESAFVALIAKTCGIEAAKCGSLLIGDVLLTSSSGGITAVPMTAIAIEECTRGAAVCGLTISASAAGSSAINYLMKKNDDSAAGKGDKKLIDHISTGRTQPKNLKEKLAMDEVVAKPGGAHARKMKMGDSRFPASDGWIKMEQNVNGVKIHYIKNTKTGATADFKFVN